MDSTNWLVFHVQNLPGSSILESVQKNTLDKKTISKILGALGSFHPFHPFDPLNKKGGHIVDGNEKSGKLTSWYGKYPIIYKVLYIQKVVGLGISEPSTVLT